MEISKVLKQLTRQFTTEELPKPARLMVTEDFDLRGLSPKQEILGSTPLCTGWMAFVNRKHTLAHVIHRDDPDTFVRIKLGHNFKGVHSEYLRKSLYVRMKDRYLF